MRDGQPAARRQTFNICMDEPVDYGELGAYLTRSRGLPTVGVRTPHHSTWLDNSKARFLLGWRPRYDLRRGPTKPGTTSAPRRPRGLVSGLNRCLTVDV